MDLAIDQGSVGHRWSLSRGLAGWGLEPVTQVTCQAELLRQRGSGVIETRAGRLQAVYGRWWPHAGNLLQMQWDLLLRQLPQDRCELYYHAPLGAPGYLTIDYVRSGPGTSVSTLYAAALVLDAIAALRQSQAIVCHVTNSRISDRWLRRWGWEQHCLHWKGRHFIKRFYGVYPQVPAHWQSRLTLG